MFRVNFYSKNQDVVVKRFRSHTVAMRNAKVWVTVAKGNKASVAIHNIEFAWFNRPSRLEW